MSWRCKHGHDDGLWEGGPCANEETADLFGKLCASHGIEPDGESELHARLYEEASAKVDERVKEYDGETSGVGWPD